MDVTGCSFGYATDGIFLYESDYVPLSCEANLIVFVVIFSALSIFRAGISVWQFKLWFRRERQRTRLTGKKRTRLPIFPLLSAIQAIVLILYTILTSFNVAN